MLSLSKLPLFLLQGSLQGVALVLFVVGDALIGLLLGPILNYIIDLFSYTGLARIVFSIELACFSRKESGRSWLCFAII